MTYSDEVLTDSPRIYLRMNESSGTVAEDSSGNNIDGVYEGSPTLSAPGLIPSDSDDAVDFDGIDDRVLISDAFDPTSYTYEIWFRPDLVNGRNIFYRTDASPDSNFSHQLTNLGDGRLRHHLFDGSGKDVESATVLSPGNIYHAAITAGDGGFMRLYVNGVEEGVPLAIGTPWAGGDRYYLAREIGGAGFMPHDGVLDEFAFYPAVLSSARILAHYNAGIATLGTGVWRSHRRIRGWRRERGRGK